MPSLPANVGTCRVKARFIRALVDGTDDDRAPEGVPLTDLVITIDADLSPKLVRNATADPPVSILIDPIVVHTDSSGVLVDDRGVADIMIVASNDTDLTPNGWSYRVTIVGPTFPRVAFSFVAPVDGVIDLSSVVPVPPNPGADLVAWQNAVASTLANKAAAQVSAAAAAASAASISPGTANGVAQLGSDSKLKTTQVPAYLDPAALSSNYETPTGAQAKVAVALADASAQDAPAAAALENVPYTIFGHSYTAVASSTAGELVDEGTNFFTRLRNRLRTQPYVDRGVAGYTMALTLAQIATYWVPGSRGLVGICSIINDARTYQDTAGATTTAEAFRGSLTYLTAQSIVSPTSGAFAYGSGWTSAVTSTAGSVVDFAFTGDATSLLVKSTVAAGSFTIKNTAGTVIRTVNFGGYKSAFTLAIPLTGFGAGDHQLRVTHVAGATTIVGAAAPNPNPPTIIWVKEGPVPISTTTVNNLMVNTYQTACATIAALFPTVIAVGTDGDYDQTTMISGDGIHPNDFGHAYFTRRILLALVGLPYRQGQNFLTGNASPAYVSPSAAYVGTGATVPAAPTGLAVTTGNQVNVSWARTTNDGGATITSQLIQSSPAGANTWTTLATANGAATSATPRTGLTSGTSYDFRVVAVNAIGNGAASSTATATAGASPVTYSADTFNRADGASLGSTDTAPVLPWTVNGGLAAISGNKVAATGAGTAPNMIYLDDGSSAGIIRWVYKSSPTVPTGVFFRCTGTTGGYLLWGGGSSWTLQRWTSGSTFTTLATFTTAGSPLLPAFGHAVEVDLTGGSTILVRVNGTQIISFVDATYAGTRHGFWTGGGVGAAWDDWSHQSI